MDAQRRAARWRTRRIVYNNDGDDVREPQNHREYTWQLLNRSGVPAKPSRKPAGA